MSRGKNGKINNFNNHNKLKIEKNETEKDNLQVYNQIRK